MFKDVLLSGDKKEKVKKAKQIVNEEPVDDKKVRLFLIPYRIPLL